MIVFVRNYVGHVQRSDHVSSIFTYTYSVWHSNRYFCEVKLLQYSTTGWKAIANGDIENTYGYIFYM